MGLLLFVTVGDPEGFFEIFVGHMSKIQFYQICPKNCMKSKERGEGCQIFLLCRFATECDFYRYWLTSFAILISSSGQKFLSPLSIFCQKYTKMKEIGWKGERWCTSFRYNG